MVSFALRELVALAEASRSVKVFIWVLPILTAAAVGSFLSQTRYIEVLPGFTAYDRAGLPSEDDIPFTFSDCRKGPITCIPRLPRDASLPASFDERWWYPPPARIAEPAVKVKPTKAEPVTKQRPRGRRLRRRSARHDDG